MSFFDTLKQFGLWPQQGAQGGQPQANPYGLDEGQMRQARMQSLSNLGSQIMAASVQQTPRQRAELMSGFDMSGGYQDNLYNAAQMKLMSAKMRSAQEGDERDRAAKAWLQQKIGTMPDSIQKRNAMIYLQLGDVQKAAEMLTAGTAQPEYQIVDGYYVNKNDPNAPAVPIAGLPQQGEDAPKPSDIRALARDYYTSPEYETYTALSAGLGSLQQNMNNDDRVADLDFVYTAANALDPGSVVRTEDGLQIVRTQGLSGEVIANLNSVLGGAALNRQTRERLYRLVSGRAKQWREASIRRRAAVLKYGAGVVSPEMLDIPIDLPGMPEPLQPPPQTVAPGRSNPPEPELIGVQD
jgi:hypothetical protein